MGADFIPQGESKYQVAEHPTGFTVTGRDRTPVTVELETTRFTVRYNDMRDEFSLFSYYDLSRKIAAGLMADWQPPNREGQDHIPRWVMTWVIKQAAGAIGKRVYTQWRRLLSLADPAILAAQKAIFSATAGRLYGRNAWADHELYQDRWLVQDIIQYRAAAVAVAEIGALLMALDENNKSQSKLALQTSPEAAAFEKLAQALGLEVTINLRTQAAQKRDPLEALRDWRGLYSPTGQPYRSLNRTLMNLPGGVPAGMLCGLPYTTLPRPILDRVELVFSLAFLCSNSTNLGIAQHARREHVLEAMRRVNAADHLNLTHRRARSLKDLAQYLADYPEPHRGNLVGLADKAIAWHREQREQEVAQAADRLGADTPAALPPVSLPDLPGVAFLGNVGAICEEGQNMGHCVGSYAASAIKGHCYLFHVERAGELATVEVNYQGQVTQAHGPRNQDNRAAAWARRALGRWGKTFPADLPQPEPIKGYLPFVNNPLAIQNVYDDIPF